MAKLEQTGYLIYTPEQIEELKQTQAKEGQLRCTECDRQLPRKRFKILDQKASPPLRAPVCMACESLKEAGALRAALAVHAADKGIDEEAKKMIKAVRKAKARRRAIRRIDQVDHRVRMQKVQRKLQPKSEAEKELLSRELASRDLLHYIERSMPHYIAGWVHEDICRRLEKFVADVELQKSPRLMLWMPPRHGKSEIASVRFPEWVLGRHPEWEFIATSYALDLPLGFSRRIRSRIPEADYQAIFSKTQLSKDATAAESWRTTAGGGYRAAGVGGGITGMGAHILLIDDPVKDQEEADSETIRQKVWDWFGTTAYTRLAPGGGILVIQTRWHDDDLSGRLQEQMKATHREIEELYEEIRHIKRTMATLAEQEKMESLQAQLRDMEATYDRWEIVKYPALATHDEYFEKEGGRIVTAGEDGVADVSTRTATTTGRFRRLRRKLDPLHPQRFTREMLLKIKRTLQPRHWSALYQQNPVPDEGLFFTKDMLRYEPRIPDYREMYTFVAWDLAIGMRQTNDWTVGVVGALDWNDDLHIIDLVRARWNAHQIADAIISTHVKYEATLTGIEKGQLELAIKPTLEKLMQERRQYITLAEGDQALKPVTDKLVRARPLQGRMQQGKLILPSDQPWVEVLVHELLRFPGGLHDDIVDSLAWLVKMILGHAPPAKPSSVAQFTSWKEKLAEFTDGGRRKHWMAA